MTAPVSTCRGPVNAGDIGPTLMHEHIFVRNPELEVNLPDGEWDEGSAIDRAVAGFEELHELGIRTVVDLTVPGLGRDLRTVAAVARRTRVNIVASTGWYTPNALPTYFAFHRPGGLIDGPDPLEQLFVRDITEGIAGTGIRAGMLKVMTDAEGMTPDVSRVLSAAASAQRVTGIPITTHSNPALRNGLEQQAFLGRQGVPPERLIIGHSGDGDDLAYLRELMDNGSTIGMDRFGMRHVLDEETRLRTVLALLELGYADRMVLSHDAAFYSHVTPPSWRAGAAPDWHMQHIPRSILPALRRAGVVERDIEQMMVRNPARLLEPDRETEEAS